MVALVSDQTDSRYLQRHPDALFPASMINNTRAYRSAVDALFDAGYFRAWNTTVGGPGVAPVKVGAMRYDGQTTVNAVPDGLVPGLAAHGMKLSALYTISQTDLSGAGAAYANMVLKFKAAGITHVFGADQLFTNAAENAGYRPRYGLTTSQYPQTVFQANSPPAQLVGSMGIGWIPTSDVDAQHDPGPTPRAQLCKQIMKGAGQDTAARSNENLSYITCDALFFLADALRPRPGTSVTAFRQAAESLGGGFRPATTFASYFAPGRSHDGAATYRVFAHEPDCSCYRYRGPQRQAAS